MSRCPSFKKIYKSLPRSVKHALWGRLSVNHKSIKPQLFLLAGLYRSFFHHILRQELPAEQRRVRIVSLRIARNSFQTVRSITIPAPVAASIVHTNVDAGYAAAFRALVLVFLQRKTAPGNLFQQGTINAVSVGNAVWC